MTYPDKSFYNGEWKEDKRDGKGLMKYIDGSDYNGEWSADKRNGKGVGKLYKIV